MKINVLTLNCWGVFTPLACEKRHERLAAIGKTLSDGHHDVVFLQEIWTDGDFENMKKALSKSHPESHYFHSNLIGSGCCIFSRYPIIETCFNRYSANGYPHRIHHGDWFGGKGVGMARIKLPDNTILACYVTHLHAEYNRVSDEYLPHRLTQMYELSSFVRLTSAGSDCVLLCGDFNFRPDSLGLKILLANTGLHDAWVKHEMAHLCEDKDGATCDRPGNSFSSASQPFPERLDYILYGNCAGTRMKCTECSLTLGRVPGQEFNYSDHEAVQGEFEVTRDVMSQGFGPDMEERRRLLTELVPLLREGVATTAGHRFYYGGCLALAVLAAGLFSFAFGPSRLTSIVHFVAGAASLFLTWTIVVVKKAEMRALLNCKLNAERLLADQ